MKRDGFIIEEIVEQRNLEDAFDSVVKGTKRKNLREGKWLIAHRAEFLEIVRQEFLSGKLTFCHITASRQKKKSETAVIKRKSSKKPEKQELCRSSVWRHVLKSMRV